MTSGVGGCVIANDPLLHRQEFTRHNLGHARDELGRLSLDHAELRRSECRIRAFRELLVAHSESWRPGTGNCKDPVPRTTP